MVVASGLTMPNGIALRDGDLYVAEISRIIRYPDIKSSLPNFPVPEVVSDEFPSETG